MLEDDFCPDLEKFGIVREELEVGSGGSGGDSELGMGGKTTSITNLVELEEKLDKEITNSQALQSTQKKLELLQSTLQEKDNKIGELE